MNKHHGAYRVAVICACLVGIAIAAGVPSLKFMERVISQQQGEQSIITEPLRVSGDTITKKQLIAYLSQHRDLSAMDEVLDTLNTPDSTKRVALTLAPQEPSALSKQLRATHNEVFFVAEVPGGKIFQRIDLKHGDAGGVFDRWTAILKESNSQRRQALYAALAADVAQRSSQLYLLDTSGVVRLIDLFATFGALPGEKAAPVAVLEATSLNSYSLPGAALNLTKTLTDFISLSPASSGSGFTITRLRDYVAGYDDEQPYAVVTLQDGDDQRGYQDEFAFIFPLSVPGTMRACGNDAACRAAPSATPRSNTPTTSQMTPRAQVPPNNTKVAAPSTDPQQISGAPAPQNAGHTGTTLSGIFSFSRVPVTPAGGTPRPSPTGGIATTAPPVCGDGNVDANEECDDGNREDGDGCNIRCKKECDLQQVLITSDELEMMQGGTGFNISAFDPYPDHAPAACEITKIVVTSPKPIVSGPIRNALGGSIGMPKIEVSRVDATEFNAQLSGLRWYGHGEGSESCIVGRNDYEFKVTAIFKNGSRAVADAVVELDYGSLAGAASSTFPFQNLVQTTTLSGYPRKKGMGWECCVGVAPDPEDSLVRVSSEVSEYHPKELQYASLANDEERYHVAQNLGQVDFSDGGLSMNGKRLDNDTEILRRYGVTRVCASTLLRSKEVACSVAREKAHKQARRVLFSFANDFQRWNDFGATKQRHLSDVRCHKEYTAKKAVGLTREKAGADYLCAYVLLAGCPNPPPRPPYFWEFVGR